jgi:hypothetical protein
MMLLQLPLPLPPPPLLLLPLPRLPVPLLALLPLPRLPVSLPLTCSGGWSLPSSAWYRSPTLMAASSGLRSRGPSMPCGRC